MRIYHNPQCSKSRQTLDLIRQAGVEPEIIEYMSQPPDADELSEVLELLGLEPRELMRSGERVYSELGLGQLQISRSEEIGIMIANPQLIERPIVVDGRRAVLGRPPANVRDLL